MTLWNLFTYWLLQHSLVIFHPIVHLFTYISFSVMLFRPFHCILFPLLFVPPPLSLSDCCRGNSRPEAREMRLVSGLGSCVSVWNGRVQLDRGKCVFWCVCMCECTQRTLIHFDLSPLCAWLCVLKWACWTFCLTPQSKAINGRHLHHNHLNTQMRLLQHTLEKELLL